MNNNEILASLRLDGKEVRVSSLDVARFFEKRHDHVIRDIRNLIKQKPQFNLPNFGDSSYTTEQNKIQPCYLMNRDGFTLLAMGFTGSRALDFKIAFIEAFNQMEASLKSGEDRSIGDKIVKQGIELMRAFDIPKDVALRQITLELKQKTGIDFTCFANPVSQQLEEIDYEDNPIPFETEGLQPVSLLIEEETVLQNKQKGSFQNFVVDFIELHYQPCHKSKISTDELYSHYLDFAFSSGTEKDFLSKVKFCKAINSFDFSGFELYIKRFGKKQTKYVYGIKSKVTL